MEKCNNCDICDRRTTLVHFNDKDGKWLKLCNTCMVPLVDKWMKENTRDDAIEIINEYRKDTYNG